MTSADGGPSSTSNRTAQARTGGLGSASRRQAAFLIEAAGRVQGPDGAEPVPRVAIGRQDLAQDAMRGGQVLALGGAFLEQPARRADVPLVGVDLEPSQLLVGLPRQVHLHRLGVPVHDLEDPAVLAMGVVGVGLVALADVGPVGHVDAAVRPVLQLQPAEPGVGGDQEIRVVPRDDLGAVARADRVDRYSRGGRGCSR